MGFCRPRRSNLAKKLPLLSRVKMLSATGRGRGWICKASFKPVEKFALMRTDFDYCDCPR